MARRLLAYLALIALGAALGSEGRTLAEAAMRVHFGVVLDAPSRQRINAEVTAWPDQKETAPKGDCPTFGDKALDIQSSPNGDFHILIDTKETTYTLVYCRGGYMSRVDPMPNDHDRSYVHPTPAELWPAKIEKGDEAAFDDEVDQSLVGALNNLSYLRSVSEDRFAAAIARLAELFAPVSSTRASAIRSVQEAAIQWRRGGSQ